MRHWIEEAKSLGQLKEVEGADLKFEGGCITDFAGILSDPIDITSIELKGLAYGLLAMDSGHAA